MYFMKKLFLVTLLALIIKGFGQSKQIVFESGNLASVLARAEKENKLIFIDAYTTWCGPCKQMSKNIFTKDTVADFFNQNFIDYKLDMEKGEGIDFAKKYEVNCYPNLLILNSKGNLVHRAAGSMNERDFIAFAKAASVPGKNFYDLKNGYEKNGLTEKTITDYILLMDNACLDASENVSRYLQGVNENELSNKVNWELIRDNVTDINSREIKYLLKNYQEFESKYNQEVEAKITKLGVSYFSTYLKAKEFDKAGFEKTKEEFLNLKWPYANHIVFDTELKLNKRFNKQAYYAIASQPEFLKYNNNNVAVLNSVAWTFYEEVTDKTQLEAAVKMAKRASEVETNYMHLDTYAAVLFKAGNYNEAEIQANKAIEKAKLQKMNANDYKETSDLLKKIKEKQKS